MVSKPWNPMHFRASAIHDQNPYVLHMKTSGIQRKSRKVTPKHWGFIVFSHRDSHLRICFKNQQKTNGFWGHFTQNHKIQVILLNFNGFFVISQTSHSTIINCIDQEKTNINLTTKKMLNSLNLRAEYGSTLIFLLIITFYI